MEHLSYNRVGVRPQRVKGLRLNHRRFSVYRLRTKFFYFIRILSRWRRKCSFGCVRKGSCKRSVSTRGLASDGARPDYKLRSYGRSNSFYTEAIADCLEFIKRSALQVDDKTVVQR